MVHIWIKQPQQTPLQVCVAVRRLPKTNWCSRTPSPDFRWWLLAKHSPSETNGLAYGTRVPRTDPNAERQVGSIVSCCSSVITPGAIHREETRTPRRHYYLLLQRCDPAAMLFVCCVLRAWLLLAKHARKLFQAVFPSRLSVSAYIHLLTVHCTCVIAVRTEKKSWYGQNSRQHTRPRHRRHVCCRFCFEDFSLFFCSSSECFHRVKIWQGTVMSSLVHFRECAKGTARLVSSSGRTSSLTLENSIVPEALDFSVSCTINTTVYHGSQVFFFWCQVWNETEKRRY